MLWLLGQRESLWRLGIHAAKDKLPVDMDSEVSINKQAAKHCGHIQAYGRSAQL